MKENREVFQSGSKYDFLEESWNTNLLNIKVVVMTTFWMSQRLAVFSTDNICQLLLNESFLQTCGELLWAINLNVYLLLLNIFDYLQS